MKKIVNQKEKDKKQDTNTKDKSIIYKRILKIGLGIISLFVLFIGIVLIYLHNSSFTVAFNEMEFNKYFNDKALEKIIRIQENNVVIEIPKDVISTAFNEKIQEIEVEKGYKINEGYINTDEGKAYINTTIHGINIPISMDIDLAVGGRKLTISFNNMMLCDNKMLSLPKQIEQSIMTKLVKNEEILKMNLDDFDIPDIVTINTITMNPENVVLRLNLDKDKTIQLLQDIINNKNEQLFEMYKDQEDIINTKVLELISKPSISNQDIELILKDILVEDEELLRNILIVTDEKKVDEVFDDYSKYITHFDKDNITNEKNKLIIGSIQEDCKKLLSAVNNLSTDKYIVSFNSPYDIDSNQGLTIKELNDINKLNIPENIYNNMNFMFDYTNKEFMVSYKIDDDRYAVIGVENNDVIDYDKYISYQFEEPLPNKVYYDTDIEAIISKYFSAEVFIRYMNTDGKYAYVIASSADNYQYYERFALEKKDTWEIVATNINDLYRFSINHPGFNVKTITDNYVEGKIYKLSDEDKSSILDQLRFKKVISDKEQVDIKYCSYDGKYISLKLTNEEEYVILIKYSYIDKVYKKEEAVNKWKDITELILLQDKNIDDDSENAN
ncbi:hypothetical protein SH1V18_30420 [Vallitalea longa]|uniref:Uncharacterized protein n=1 Tax=Vallitalea longa TaxID=2936439 RepID=A0A9W5YAU7_9FIRM|nr:hypothetical protein [Vallitalea longa]GKX30562.1 hypothetical protein SH1V18_30420 [Vallitalea longa]